MEEVESVVSLLPSGKSPGPDGFTNQYYKVMFNTIGPHLCTYFNAVTRDSPLPPEALLAHIVVLPKQGKDPRQCASYRPI